jgi:anthranilate phosphoribosyltransferase
VTPAGTRTYSVTPDEGGFQRTPLDAVKTGSAAENAARIRAVFAGARGPDRDYIIMNAGAALMAAGKADSLRAGVEVAADTVDSGAARKTLNAFVALTTRLGAQA